MRDKLIKEKLGISVSNFMPANGTPLVPAESGVEILSMQDIDRISKELILPSLNMTKSTSFTPNFQQAYSSPQDNPLRPSKGALHSDNPYT